MAFTFAAFCYMLSLVLCAALIFFAIWHVSNRQRVLTLQSPQTRPCPTPFPISPTFCTLREASQAPLLSQAGDRRQSGVPRLGPFPALTGSGGAAEAQRDALSRA
jgi:hypothetical protein